MTATDTTVAAIDPVWNRMLDEAQQVMESEPLMGGMLHAGILHHNSLEDALSYRISQKLASADMPEQILREITYRALADGTIGQSARADLAAVLDRDPACHHLILPMMFFKGFQAIESHRVAHWLWMQGRKPLANFVQSRTSEVFGVDIHPGARLGRGIMIDHAHSVVIGETAVVGDNVSMLHSVTLGGTGKEDDDRHPKIGDGFWPGFAARAVDREKPFLSSTGYRS
ncbi:MAG: serine O-acetyltransferase, partial [Pseudomonadota bacterium]